MKNVVELQMTIQTDSNKQTVFYTDEEGLKM